MNWKVLCLIPGLTLIALPAYSNTNSNTQTAPSVLIAQSNQQGGSMMNGGSMKKPDTMMNSGSVMNGGSMMKIGSRGEQVKAAQSFLTRQGFYAGPINGIFDDKTRLAVTKFQNSKKDYSYWNYWTYDASSYAILERSI